VASIRLRYVKSYIDRHGKVRHYVRKPGCKLVPLSGLPGSDEFLTAYSAAVSLPAGRVEIGASRTRAGSVNAMIVGFLGSAQFAGLASTSQGQYRRILEVFRREFGDLGIATLQRRHIIKMLDDKAAQTPTAARDLLRCLKLLLKYALSIGARDDDPTAGVRVKLPKSDGFRTWSEADIVRFEAAYAIGTKPRLAIALLLATAARIADVVRLGRGHVRDGAILMVQKKTGASVAIPVTSALAEAINAAAPSEHVVFLLNERGRAFTAHAFSKWFVKQCRRAGLDKGLSAHGLRKASCRRLAEAGCTPHEIMAISGHVSLKEVTRYTAAADRMRLARNAMDRLNRTDGVRGLSHLAAEAVSPSEKAR
jgi:integrase